MKIISLPLPDEVLDLIDQVETPDTYKDYIIDINSIHYNDEELEKNKIESSLIYLRNVDLPIARDFSKLTYDDKKAWLIKYMEVGLDDLILQELDDTWLQILLDTPISTISSILTNDEIVQFKKEYDTLINKIYEYCVSFLLLIPYLLIDIKRKSFADIQIDDEFPITEEVPIFTNLIFNLLHTHPLEFSAICLCQQDRIQNPILYKNLFIEMDNRPDFYKDFTELSIVKFMCMINSKESKDE